ncbi:hypothetical protein [Streptomyces narbonensis]|uniref:hypothetical protein n=1 Tax=Streptomyces narbonensis TaxID=67333 RepID=UPI0033F987A4
MSHTLCALVVAGQIDTGRTESVGPRAALTPDRATINQALAALGVKGTATVDEFEVIGLGGFRSNPDYLQAYVALCDELGV